MRHGDDKEIQRLLKEAFPPVDRELRRHLWPAMLGRLEARGSAVRWYDWALLALLCIWMFLCPQGILQLLYQL